MITMDKQEKIKRIKLRAKKRSKTKAKTLVRKGILPAILYGPRVKTQALELEIKEAEKAFKDAGTSQLIDLEIEGEASPKKVLIYDSQYDPVKDKLIHLDFYAVRMDKPIKAEIPIEYNGESDAVRTLGGTLLINKDAIEVECLPQDLVEEFKVDLSRLKTFDDMVKLSDLDIPQGIELLEDKDTVLALVQPPRSEEELAELEEKPVEDIEAVEVEVGKEEEGLPAEEAGEEGAVEKPVPKEGEIATAPLPQEGEIPVKKVEQSQEPQSQKKE